jgi:hypothetical protein
MNRWIGGTAAALLALTAAGAAQAKPVWPAGGAEEARRTAKQVVMIAIRGAAQPRGNIGTCRIEAIVVGTVRGSGPPPGAPFGALVPCVHEPHGPNPRTEGGRYLPMDALDGGALARIYLLGGKAVDLELLGADASPIEPAAKEADRRQLWRLIHAGSGDSILVDTDDVEAEGTRRTAWVKVNPKKREQNIVQTLTRATYDCAARTQTLHAWYARTGDLWVHSQGTVPEALRVTVPVEPGTAFARALSTLCARPRLPEEG